MTLDQFIKCIEKQTKHTSPSLSCTTWNYQNLQITHVIKFYTQKKCLIGTYSKIEGKKIAKNLHDFFYHII